MSQDNTPVVIDEGDVTPAQQLKLATMGYLPIKRADHPRRGPYRWGYYQLTVSIAKEVNIPQEYWEISVLLQTFN
ncbi:Hypothetical protein POVR1_LOCUS156 [uncultured virus]|nr:Hypothetical protein POVR1_LOCUS156 [uncultured virus]